MNYRERFYEKYATNVQEQSEPISREEAADWGRIYRTHLRGWLPERKDADILDVACGHGKLLLLFSTEGYKNVQGVDISPEQVELALHLHPQVVQADTLQFLEHHQNCFDLITGIDIIEHLTKDEILTFLDRCRGALRLGGRLVLQTPNGESIWRGANLHGDFTHETCLNPKSLGQLFRACGFDAYEAREMAPVPHGFVSLMRRLLWKLVRLQYIIINMVETGDSGSGIFTRVFIASAVRPRDLKS